MMPLTTSRMFTVRLLPPRLAGGMSWSWEIGQGVKVYSSSDRGIRDEDETAVYV